MVKKLLVTGLIAATTTVFGGTFDTVDGFSITLPAGWTKIPGAALQRLSQNASARHPENPIVFGYGYQLKASGKHNASPYILVQFKAVNPALLDHVRDNEAIHHTINTGLEKVMESFAGKVSNASVSGPTYDAAHDMVWASMDMDVKGHGNMKALVGIKRTKTGLIQLNGYAPADVFDAYVQCFKTAFTSLGIEEGIRFQPPVVQRAQPLQQKAHSGIGRTCLLAGLFGGVMWLIKILIVRIVRMLLRTRTWPWEAHIHSPS